MSYYHLHPFRKSYVITCSVLKLHFTNQGWALLVLIGSTDVSRQCVGGCVGEDDSQMSLCVCVGGDPSCHEAKTGLVQVLCAGFQQARHDAGKHKQLTLPALTDSTKITAALQTEASLRGSNTCMVLVHFIAHWQNVLLQCQVERNQKVHPQVLKEKLDVGEKCEVKGLMGN